MFLLKLDSRAQTVLGAFFGAKRKMQCLSGDSDYYGVCKKSTTDMTATTSADLCKANATNTSINKGHIKTSVGIIRIQSTEHKNEIGWYSHYASISS